MQGGVKKPISVLENIHLVKLRREKVITHLLTLS